jgi:TIR domain
VADEIKVAGKYRERIMADIFLSYARKDVEKARQMADALTRDRWTVWWDPKIPTATEWERVLLPELEKARCVVVLWSGHSVRSKWVRREAEAALERTVLVPALIEAAPIPAATGSIQVANLTKWAGSPTAPEFQEFLDAVRERMLPTCEIRFRSLLDPEPESVMSAVETLVQVGMRVNEASGLDGFYDQPPNAAYQRRLQRTIASVGVTIHWPSALTELFAAAVDQDRVKEMLVRIPRRIPLLWLGLYSYAGPFQNHGPDLRIHRNFLKFASLSLYHTLLWIAERSGRHIDVQHPLTTQFLSYPRWEDAITVFFDPADELAWAYVDRLGEQYLYPDVVIYGPRGLSELAYERSLDRSSFAGPDPRWFEEYFVPQYELLLTMSNPDRIVDYDVTPNIRKVTDGNGVDFQSGAS